MSENIVAEKNYKTACIIAVILGVLLLICLYKLSDKPEAPIVNDTSQDDTLIRDGIKLPIGSALRKFLDAGKYTSVYLVRDNAQVKVVDSGTGKDVEVCANLGNSSQIPKECNYKNRELKSMSVIVLFDLVNSPGCGGRIGNYLRRCR